MLFNSRADYAAAELGSRLSPAPVLASERAAGVSWLTLLLLLRRIGLTRLCWATGAAEALQAALLRPPPLSPRAHRGSARGAWGSAPGRSSPTGRTSSAASSRFGRTGQVTPPASPSTAAEPTVSGTSSAEGGEIAELRQMLVLQSRQIATLSAQVKRLGPEEGEPEDGATRATRAEIREVMMAIQAAGGPGVEARQLAVHAHAAAISDSVDFLVKVLGEGEEPF